MITRRQILLIFTFIVLIAIGLAAYFVYTNRFNYSMFGKNSLAGNTKTDYSLIQKDLSNMFDKADFTNLNLEIDSLLKESPDEINYLLQKVRALTQQASLEFREKELGDEAKKYILQILAKDPKNVEALVLLGYVYEIQQNYPEAHKNYDLALAIDPTNVEALSQKAHAYDLVGNIANAEKMYKKSIEIDPNNPKTLSGYARLLMAQGKFEEAKTIFIKAANLTENKRLKAEIYYSLGTISEKPVYSSEAENYYKQSINFDQTLALAYVGLGRELFKKSFSEKDQTKQNAFLDDSFKNLETALKINPNQSYATLQVALQLISLQKELALAKNMLLDLQKNVSKDITLSALDKEVMKNITEVTLKNLK